MTFFRTPRRDQYIDLDGGDEAIRTPDSLLAQQSRGCAVIASVSSDLKVIQAAHNTHIAGPAGHGADGHGLILEPGGQADDPVP